MSDKPTAQDKATAAINRRRAQGLFGRTDGLEFILGRYQTDLSEFLNHGTPAARKTAGAAADIAVDFLKANAEAASKAKKIQTEMDRVIEYAYANAAQNIEVFGIALDLRAHVELVAHVAQVQALLTALDKLMARFTS